MPPKALLVLGKLYDWEVGNLFGVSNHTARNWRLGQGIEEVCKTCRIAELKQVDDPGFENRCPQHAKPPPAFVSPEPLVLEAAEAEIVELEERRDAALVRVKALSAHLLRGEPLPGWLDRQIRPFRDVSDEALQVLVTVDKNKDAAFELVVRPASSFGWEDVLQALRQGQTVTRKVWGDLVYLELKPSCGEVFIFRGFAETGTAPLDVSLTTAASQLDLRKALQGLGGKPNFSAIARSMLADPLWVDAKSRADTHQSLAAMLNRKDFSRLLFGGRKKPVFIAVLAESLGISRDELVEAFQREHRLAGIRVKLKLGTTEWVSKTHSPTTGDLIADDWCIHGGEKE